MKRVVFQLKVIWKAQPAVFSSLFLYLRRNWSLCLRQTGVSGSLTPTLGRVLWKGYKWLWCLFCRTLVWVFLVPAYLVPWHNSTTENSIKTRFCILMSKINSVNGFSLVFHFRLISVDVIFLDFGWFIVPRLMIFRHGVSGRFKDPLSAWDSTRSDYWQQDAGHYFQLF